MSKIELEDLSAVKLIAVSPYGSNGLMPQLQDVHRCPLGGEASCVGASGDSLCSGYTGDFHTKDYHYVMCAYD